MSSIVVRARKFFTNRLFNRKQFIVDVTHPDAPNVPKKNLREVLAKKYKCEERCVVLFGFKTKFGGMRSTGFCLIYDKFDLLKKYEPRHRKFAMGLEQYAKQGDKRKTKKTNKIKKLRGHHKIKKKKKDDD